MTSSIIERKSRNKFLAIRNELILFVVIILVGYLYILNELAYFTGLTNPSLLLYLLILELPIIVISIGFLAFQLWKVFGKAKPDDVAILAKKRLLFGSVIVLAISFMFYQPWRLRHTEGLRDRMVRMNFEKELPVIREWLGQIGKGGGGYPVMIPIENCPAPIKRLRPRRVWLGGDYGDYEDTSNPVEFIGISWAGGPIGGWGVIVGPETMRIPEPSENGYILPFAPGAYVCHEAE